MKSQIIRYIAAFVGVSYVACLVAFVVDIHIEPSDPIIGPAHDARWDHRYDDLRSRGYKKKEAKEWADALSSPCL